MYSLSDIQFEEEKKIETLLEASCGYENFHPDLSLINKFVTDHKISFHAKIITVAGTNGKGEVSRSLTYLLRTKGVKVALWTSPHILSIRERFFYDGELIGYEDFYTLYQKLELWKKNSETHLSYFETLFALFLLWIQDKKLDFIVLEVGLGGRLDASNVLFADYCVITSIGRDHQEFLGTHYRDIIKEKLGIVKEGAELFTEFSLTYLNELTEKYIQNLNLHWFKFKNSKLFDFRMQNREFAKFILSHVLPTEDFSRSIDSETSLHPIMGRKQIEDREIYFFGSHNPEAMRKLVQFLATSPYNKVEEFDYLIFSLSKRSLSDTQIVIDLITQIKAKRRIFVQMGHHKAQDIKLIKKILESRQIEIHKELKDKAFQEIKRDSKLLITGSNYFVGEFYKFFCLRKK